MINSIQFNCVAVAKHQVQHIKYTKKTIKQAAGGNKDNIVNI